MSLDELIDRLENDEPRGLEVQQFAGVGVTVDEIREALTAHPHHPLAWIFAGAIEGRRGEERLACDRNDLLGLATNREVTIKRVQVDDDVHKVKELGPSLDPVPTADGPENELDKSDEPAAPRSPASSLPPPRGPRPADPPDEDPAELDDSDEGLSGK